MEVKVDNHEVIAHGTIVSQGEEVIFFGFSEKVNLRFEFAPTDEKEGQRIAWRIENETTLVGRLSGFDATPGPITNRKPIEVGILNGKKLFLNFALNYIGTSENHTRVFHYTFYRVDV